MTPTAPTATAERRRAARVSVHLPMAVRLSGATGEEVAAEVLEAGVDGRGVALLLPNHCGVLVGATIALVMEKGPAIAGIVISRLGTQGRYRVGVRVDAECRPQMQSWLREVGIAVDF